jgi:membrane-associated HD superfamily phosphohydrolase
MIILNENNSKNNIIVLKEEGIVGRLIVFLILLSFLFSQFYFWSSGFPQFSHLFILSAIFLFFIKNIEIDIKESKNIIFLVSYISCVNLFWCLINFDYSYISSTIYWIFNLFFFLLMISLNKSQQNFILEKILGSVDISSIEFTR